MQTCRWLLATSVLSAILLVSSSALVGAQEQGQSHVVPLRPFSPDHRFEKVSGDHTKPGVPFVIRIHAEAGFIIMPHIHPEDENIVVLKGTWSVGMGDRFDEQRLEPMEAGAYGLVPRQMAHFGLSRTNTILQVHGIGPFTTQYVVPVYRLTDAGILKQTSAAEPGQPVPSSPPDCFALKIGSRVRDALGEGIIAEAQCTPGQLTQYRVRHPSGDHTWARREALTTP